MIHALNWLFLNAFILLEKRIELKNECIQNELKMLNAFNELKKKLIELKNECMKNELSKVNCQFIFLIHFGIVIFFTKKH